MMDADWFNSPSARLVLSHWRDRRPAWLWSADGQVLLWRNQAARLFRAKLKKSGLKLAAEPVPIRGQTKRLLRHGTLNRLSPARLQFLAGGKPVAATCLVAPVVLGTAGNAVLLVGVDPIHKDLLGAELPPEAPPGWLLPRGAGFAVLSAKGEVLEASSDTPLASAMARIALTGGSTLLIFRGKPEQSSVEEANSAILSQSAAPEAAAPPGAGQEPESAGTGRRDLTGLLDRLAASETLYNSIDDHPMDDGAARSEAGEEATAPDAKPAGAAPGPDSASAAPSPGRPESLDVSPPDGAMLARLFRITGRGFRAFTQAADAQGALLPEGAPANGPAQAQLEPAEPEAGGTEPPAPTEPPDAEVVERVSRYNFDELSRILTDRIGLDPRAETAASADDDQPKAREGELINLTGETFVLNRLPIGLLVFRDQQVLFANRAMTDLTGHENSEALRLEGLASIFPAMESASTPVTHLLSAEGKPIAVSARLQSISWQGKPALMLSATPVETGAGHEAAVRAFAEILASARDEGFVELNRSGAIEAVSAHALVLFGRTADELLGRPVSAVADPAEGPALRAFLEMPARFAETTRPSLLLKGIHQGYDLTLFAKGQAGIVSGYFGLVRRCAGALAPVVYPPQGDVDPALLARLSRDLRRPLNTVIGFSELLSGSGAATADKQRHAEYARDIKSAGEEIASLVEELDEFARLRDGRYAARPVDFDLGLLLEACVQRVRSQASLSRVLVRSAISERMPRIRADRASLSQAVLNLLASAIAETPAGNAVVLSAQWEDDGSAAVHVRDAATNAMDPSERFVVFRDGLGRDGEALGPVRSTLGLALTRSLLAVNACSLSVEPGSGAGTLFALFVPKELIVSAA